MIENFRAVRHIDLPIDETTLLIGENGSGKTSIFDALNACLGVRSQSADLLFERRDFRPAPDSDSDDAVEPIRIVLRFEELKDGPWPDACRQEFAPVIRNKKNGLAVVNLEVRARWVSAAEEAETDSAFLDLESKPVAVPAEVIARQVAELRRRNPFLVFSSNHRAEIGSGAEYHSAEQLIARPGIAGPELEEFTREIYDKLSESWEVLTQKDLRKARAASKQIWKQFIHPREKRGLNQSYRPPSGGAQSLGPLLVFGALLRARGSERLDRDVDPILATEHFGAHLHPATLGAVRQVLQRLPAQKLISTYSGEMVSAMPLRSIRRIVRRRSGVDVYRFREERLKKDDRRRLAYHIRARRGGALFDRCWLLVEGETEFWLLPEMARISGYELDAEGVSIVEFAQCGIRPILELARDLGISWHLLADGDEAGDLYVQSAEELMNGRERDQCITQLPGGDMEEYLWSAGYADVYRESIRSKRKRKHHRDDRRSAIGRAINSRSKPFLALSALEACREAGSPGVPPLLRTAIETSVLLARAN